MIRLGNPSPPGGERRPPPWIWEVVVGGPLLILWRAKGEEVHLLQCPFAPLQGNVHPRAPTILLTVPFMLLATTFDAWGWVIFIRWDFPLSDNINLLLKRSYGHKISCIYWRGAKEGLEGPSFFVRGGMEGRGTELLARRGKKEFPPKKMEVIQVCLAHSSGHKSEKGMTKLPMDSDSGLF